jgi:hypothetical protein
MVLGFGAAASIYTYNAARIVPPICAVYVLGCLSRAGMSGAASSAGGRRAGDLPRRRCADAVVRGDTSRSSKAAPPISSRSAPSTDSGGTSSPPAVCSTIAATATISFSGALARAHGSGGFVVGVTCIVPLA